MRSITRAVALATVAGLCAGATADTVSGGIVIMEGDALDGSTVTSLNSPFTTGSGQVSFVAALADGTRSIWLGAGSIFNSGSTLDPVLNGAEGTMGAADSGAFIYSPSIDGEDGVFGESGTIARGTEAAPGFPGFNITFASRPEMDDAGNAYWSSGLNNGAGGTGTASRVLYKRDTGGNYSTLIAGGDVIAGTGGLTVDTGAQFFDYDVSGNGAHFIAEVTADTASASDAMVVVNGAMVAQEGSATGAGDNWQAFDHVSINNAGNYMFSGDTNAATSADEFVAYNGNIVFREDDVVDGLTLGSSVNALSLNDLGQAAFIWSTDQETETLFFASDASSAASAIKLLSVGDELDADGNGTGDWLIDDFNASGVVGQGLDLAEDGWVYVEVDLESLDGTTNLEAIIRVRVPAPATLGLLGALGLAGLRRRR